MMPTYTKRVAYQLWQHNCETIIRRMTLFPGWTLTVEDIAVRMDGNHTARFLPTLPPRPNSIPQTGAYFNPTAAFRETAVVNSTMAPNEILARILAVFLSLQEHECLEFVQMNGRPVLSPHRPHHYIDWDYYKRCELHTQEIIRTLQPTNKKVT